MGINSALTFQSMEMISVESADSDDDLITQKQNEIKEMKHQEINIQL